MTELLPCPFCGEKPALISPCESDHMWAISCSYCCMELASVSKEEAVKRWNTRHYPPEVEKAVERMKPKKVLDTRYKYDDRGEMFFTARCPSCGDDIFNNALFCECGQRLDWSEEK